MGNVTVNSSRVNKQGFVTLHLRVRIDGKSISKALNIKVKANQWKGRIVNHTYSIDLNRWINEEVARCYELLSLYEIKKYTFAQLSDKVKGQQNEYKDFLEGYLAEKDKLYTSAFNQYKTIVGAVEVTNEGLNKFIKDNQKSPATVKTYVTAIRTVHNDLVRLGKADKIKYDLIKIVQRPVRNKATTVDEVIMRLEDAKPKDYHYHAIAVFALLNGGLYYTDVEKFKPSKFHIRSKTGVSMPVAECALELFKTIDLSKVGKRYIAIKTPGFKKLRRLYETVATNQGIDWTLRRRLIGHTITDISKHYYDLDCNESESKLFEAQHIVLQHLQYNRMLDILSKLSQ